MYTPLPEYLEKYADLLVNFSLWWGKGIEKGQVVMIQIPISARPLLPYIYTSVLKSWWHPIVDMISEDVTETLFEFAQDEQLTRVPQKILDAKIEEVDHMIRIISHEDKKSLENVDPAKLMIRQQSFDEYKKAMIKKENNWQLSWTLWLYGTESMASCVGMTHEDYRNQIIKACYLDYEQPIQEWKRIYSHLDLILSHLNSLSIQSLEVKWTDIDLKIWLGKNRKRLAGSWCNMPSFEVFISPDRRETEWRIRCNQPLYMYGKMITGIELKFSAGIIVDSRATQWEDLLKEMLAIPWADKLWEFSLTDMRMSRITKFMWETLYDENVWWEYGNTHIAIGNSFRQSYPWDIDNVTPEQWSDRWYNQSTLHTDLVSTSDRTVIATLMDGSQEVIYQHWRFTFYDQTVSDLA